MTTTMQYKIVSTSARERFTHSLTSFLSSLEEKTQALYFATELAATTENVQIIIYIFNHRDQRVFQRILGSSAEVTKEQEADFP
jgi:hypothetical protein